MQRALGTCLERGKFYKVVPPKDFNLLKAKTILLARALPLEGRDAEAKSLCIASRTSKEDCHD